MFLLHLNLFSSFNHKIIQMKNLNLSNSFLRSFNIILILVHFRRSKVFFADTFWVGARTFWNVKKNSDFFFCAMARICYIAKYEPVNSEEYLSLSISIYHKCQYTISSSVCGPIRTVCAISISIKSNLVSICMPAVSVWKPALTSIWKCSFRTTGGSQHALRYSVFILSLQPNSGIVS